ncbi:alpha-L-arabinofuranosidase [Puia dinghuensis]|nr:alpha-L-arabinofuranosidase [Puia dinghuensis]
MRTLINAGLVTLSLGWAACGKSSHPSGSNGNNGNTSVTDSIYAPVDPSTPPSIGLFSNSWQAKSFNVPATTAGTAASGSVTDSLTINVNKVLVKVPPYVYGNNSNLWMGQIVTQPALMGYLKDLSPRIIRAPAGSVSDVYFFNDTTAAPADAPDTLVNADGSYAVSPYWYGGNTASWTLALSNYYSMLAQTSSTGIITVNYGYARYGTSANPVAAAAHLAANWVRYDNGRTKFWEIGNETYGSWEAGYRIDQSKNKDGQPQIITGALYGSHFKVFADSMRAAAQQIGATIYLGASLYSSAPASWDNTTVQTWNQGVLSQAGNTPDFYIVHNYYTAYNTNSSVSDILSSSIPVTTNMMNYIQQQESAGGVTAKPVALTEWNIQATGSKQDVSYIAGIHAAKTLGSIIKNQFGEASRWDLANGWNNGDDMGMFNHGDEPGAPLWNPRPAFYYLYYFQQFFGDRMVADSLKAINSDLTTYSSTFSSGQAGTIIVNSGTMSHIVTIDFQHFPAGSNYYWYTLTGGTDNGNFSGQVYVNGTGPSSATGGPLTYASLKANSAALTGTIRLAVPPLSAVYLVADKK